MLSPPSTVNNAHKRRNEITDLGILVMILILLVAEISSWKSWKILQMNASWWQFDEKQIYKVKHCLDSLICLGVMFIVQWLPQQCCNCTSTFFLFWKILAQVWGTRWNFAYMYHWIPSWQSTNNMTPAVIWILFCRWCTWPTTVVLFVPGVIGQATHLPLLLPVVLWDLYPDASLGMVLVLSHAQGLAKYFLAGHLPKIYLSWEMMWFLLDLPMGVIQFFLWLLKLPIGGVNHNQISGLQICSSSGTIWLSVFLNMLLL